MNCSCLEGTESHVTFDCFLEGAEHNDELEADGVPPYEDRLGPDGWAKINPIKKQNVFYCISRAEGENPVLPQPAPSSPKSEDGEDQFDEDQDEQCKSYCLSHPKLLHL